MDKIQMELFEQLTGLHEIPAGAYNIRANSKKDSRNTTANIDIVTKEDKCQCRLYLLLLQYQYLQKYNCKY